MGLAVGLEDDRGRPGGWFAGAEVVDVGVALELAAEVAAPAERGAGVIDVDGEVVISRGASQQIALAESV